MIKNTFATLVILVVLLLGLGMTSAATLAEWSLESNGSASNVNTNIAAGNFTNNSVEVVFSTTGARANDWSTGAINTSKYFQITVSPAAGYNISISDINFGERRSDTGIRNYSVQWSKNADFSASTIIKTEEVVNDSNERIGDISGLNIGIGNGETLYVRWFGYNAEASGGTWRINDNTLSIEGAVTSTSITPPTPSANTWCEEDFTTGEKGDLEITMVDIINHGQGDDNLWEYLDEIEIEITVENTHNDNNINDVVIEIEIRDEKGNTYTKKDFDLNDDKDKVGRVKKDGGEETIKFTINELPIDVEADTYRLYVRAYEDGNEAEQCVSKSNDFTDDDETYFEFDVEASQDSLIIVKNNMDNILASCGDDKEVKFKVYNTGSSKEDKVLVNLYSSALGIDEHTVIDNLRAGSGKEATFFISVPQKMSKNSANLDIVLFYDYDKDEKELDEFAYGENSDDAGSDFSIGLEIISCQAPEPTITAVLDSATQVGQDLVIKATIKNNAGNSDFIISASGFESWAELVSIEPQTVSIDEDGSQEVLITLTPTEAGAQSFKIITLVDGAQSEQTVSLNIAEKKGIFGFSNNIMAYAIIGIVAVLVLIFLVLIVRISKRTSAPQF